MTACGGENKETEEAVKDQVEAEEPEEEEYEFGVLTDTGYESKWLNVKFTAPENYIMVTAEEMNEMMERGAEAVNEEMLRS